MSSPSSYGMVSPGRPLSARRSSTVSSASSFQLLSSGTRSDLSDSDSDDEIVWGLASSDSNISITSDVEDAADDDFVVLTRRAPLGRNQPSGIGQVLMMDTGGAPSEAVEESGGVATPVELEVATGFGIRQACPRTDSTSDVVISAPAIIEALRSRLNNMTLNQSSQSKSPAPAVVAAGVSLEAEPNTKDAAAVPETATTPITLEESESTHEKFEVEDRKTGDPIANDDNLNAHGLPTPDVSPTRERKNLRELSTPVPNSSSLKTQNGSVSQATTKTKGKKDKKGGKIAKKSTTEAKPAVTTAGVKKPKKKKKKSKGKGKSKKADSPKAAAAPAPEARPVDASMFQEATTYISSFLLSPEAKSNSVCRLTLLQSLIIELGLISSSLNLPASLKSAKTFLKSHAFLNIKEYISVRDQGQQAIQKLLYPSRSALIRDIRKKRNAASLNWVKEHGLQVLLVGCFH